jgi:hypothetical protein
MDEGVKIMWYLRLFTALRFLSVLANLAQGGKCLIEKLDWDRCFTGKVSTEGAICHSK